MVWPLFNSNIEGKFYRKCHSYYIFCVQRNTSFKQIKCLFIVSSVYTAVYNTLVNIMKVLHLTEQEQGINEADTKLLRLFSQYRIYQ